VLHNFVMARSEPQINIRIPELLKLRLEDAAKDAGRSFTAEVVSRLDASISGDNDVLFAKLSRDHLKLKLEHGILATKLASALAALPPAYQKAHAVEIREMALQAKDAMDDADTALAQVLELAEKFRDVKGVR
jgi:hypothetical protein